MIILIVNNIMGNSGSSNLELYRDDGNNTIESGRFGPEIKQNRRRTGEPGHYDYVVEAREENTSRWQRCLGVGGEEKDYKDVRVERDIPSEQWGGYRKKYIKKNKNKNKRISKKSKKKRKNNKTKHKGKNKTKRKINK